MTASISLPVGAGAMHIVLQEDRPDGTELLTARYTLHDAGDMRAYAGAGLNYAQYFHDADGDPGPTLLTRRNRHSSMGAAAELGARLQQQLAALSEEFACIGEVRGRGLMVGVELVDATAAPDALGARPAVPELAARVQRECLRCGLIVELGGRHGSVVRFLPPLTITAAQVDEVARIFGWALAAASV